MHQSFVSTAPLGPRKSGALVVYYADELDEADVMIL